MKPITPHADLLLKIATEIAREIRLQLKENLWAFVRCVVISVSK